MNEAFLNRAPKWVRAIRWKDWGNRIANKQKTLATLIFGPIFFAYLTDPHRYITELYLQKPQTDEERMAIKEAHSRHLVFQRDWQINEFHNDLKPLYDLSTRRLKYPQYYEGRYEKKSIPNIWGEYKD